MPVSRVSRRSVRHLGAGERYRTARELAQGAAQTAPSEFRWAAPLIPRDRMNRVHSDRGKPREMMCES
jgi:hypothetical protein